MSTSVPQQYQGSHLAYGVSVSTNVRIPLRDGLTLAADVYRPALPSGEPAPGRYPTIVYRTPYDRKRQTLYQSARYFAARGYNWVAVDVRGRFESDGDFHLYHPNCERDDGYDTIEWTAAQPWSDGKIGTTGLSFEGASQQAAATARPPHLVTQILVDAGINYWRRTLRNNGTFAEGIYAPYAVRMAMQGKEAMANPAVRRELEAFHNDIDTWIKRLPLRRGATPLALAPSYEKWFFEFAHQGDFTGIYNHPNVSLEDHLDDYPDIPVFMMASWYGNRHAWANFKKLAEFRKRNRSPVKLIMGHWLHQEVFMEQTYAGKVDFGLDSFLSLDDYRLRWFDRFLKDYETGILEEPLLLARRLGGGSGLRNYEGRMQHGGTWQALESWPPAGFENKQLFLHRDGALSESRPESQDDALTYNFNPANPVPTIGGGMQTTKYIDTLTHCGGFDQVGQKGFSLSTPGERLSGRPDVLVFRTPRLESAVEVTGDIFVELWVSTSAPDTDFTAKLVDEYPPNVDYPHGFELNLVDDIERMSYRDGRLKRELVTPGELYKITIGPLLISNCFGKGHRIRVDISSSSFPQFDVNPNTGAPYGASRGTVIARNTVLLNAVHASVLKLPVKSLE